MTKYLRHTGDIFSFQNMHIYFPRQYVYKKMYTNIRISFIYVDRGHPNLYGVQKHVWITFLNSWNKKDIAYSHVFDTNRKQLHIISKIKMENVIFILTHTSSGCQSQNVYSYYCTYIHMLSAEGNKPHPRAQAPPPGTHPRL